MGVAADIQGWRLDAYEVEEAGKDLRLLLGRPPRVLVAEDDDEVRWSLAALLLDRGYDVQTVCNGVELHEALLAATVPDRVKNPPDVVVTDVRMPGFNALNVLTRMRDAGWDAPIIVISAFGDAQLRDRVDQLGDAEFFDKPLDLEVLEAAIMDAAYLYARTWNMEPN